MTTTTPSPTQRRVWICASVAGVAIVVLLALLSVPVSHSFSDQFTTFRLHLGDAMLSVPAGAVVTASWSANSSSPVAFDVVDSNDYPIYQTTGTNGTFSFPATAPPYGFVGLGVSNASQSVTVSGTYSVPIL